MPPRTLRLLAFPFLAHQSLALRRATRETPTDYKQHLPWVADLFTPSGIAEAEEVLKTDYPTVYHAIKDALSTPPDVVGEVRDKACRLVYSLSNSEDERIKPYLAAAGGISATYESLAAYLNLPEDPMWPRRYIFPMEMCAKAMGRLGRDQHDVQEEAGKQGWVELLLQFERHFDFDGAAQIFGTNADLMSLSVNNRKRWAAAGGIKYTMKAVRKHYMNSEVVLQGFAAFNSGVQYPNEHTFADNEGLELGVRALKDHGRATKDHDGQYSYLPEEVVHTMWHISNCVDLKQKLVNADYLQILLTTAYAHPDNFQIQYPMCATAEALAEANPTLRNAVAAAGFADAALTAVVRALETTPSSSDSSLQSSAVRYCVGALAALVGNPSVRESLMSQHASQDIQAAKTTFAGNPAVQRAATKLLDALD